MGNSSLRGEVGSWRAGKASGSLQHGPEPGSMRERPRWPSRLRRGRSYREILQPRKNRVVSSEFAMTSKCLLVRGALLWVMAGGRKKREHSLLRVKKTPQSRNQLACVDQVSAMSRKLLVDHQIE